MTDNSKENIFLASEENKDIVRRFHDGMLEFFRTGNLDFLLHTVHPECAFGMPGMPSTVDGMKQAGRGATAGHRSRSTGFSPGGMVHIRRTLWELK